MTEVIWDNHDPDFVKQFDVDYLFEEAQKFELKKTALISQHEIELETLRSQHQVQLENLQ